MFYLFICCLFICHAFFHHVKVFEELHQINLFIYYLASMIVIFFSLRPKNIKMSFNTEIKNMHITEKVYSIVLINEFIQAALNFLTFNQS